MLEGSQSIFRISLQMVPTRIDQESQDGSQQVINYNNRKGWDASVGRWI